MEEISAIAALFKGVAGNLSSVTSVAALAPSIIGEAFDALPDAEAAIPAVTKFAEDVAAGSYGTAISDVGSIVSAGTKILSDFKISIPGLTAAAAKIPATPAISTLQLAKANVAPVAPAHAAPAAAKKA